MLGKGQFESKSITTLVEAFRERCDLGCMPDKISDQTSGWLVRVRTAAVGGGSVYEGFWMAAFSDKGTAVEAVKQKLSTRPDQPVDAVKKLPAKEIKGQGLAPGEIKQHV